jgi:Trypsin
MIYFSNSPAYYRVIAGTLRHGNPGSTHTVEEINTAAWNGNTNENDISLWRVSPSFNFDTTTNAIGIPAQGAESLAGTVMTVSGWGTTSVSFKFDRPKYIFVVYNSILLKNFLLLHICIALYKINMTINFNV